MSLGVMVENQQYKKILPIFFCVCVSLSYRHRFTNYFEILNFAFSNIIPRRVSTSEILALYD